MKKIAKIIALILILTLGATSLSSCDLNSESIDADVSNSATADNNGLKTDTNTTTSPEPNAKAGFYFQEDEIVFRNPITVGTSIPKNSRLAYFNDKGEMSTYYVDDGNKRMTMNDWYGSGNTQYTVKKIDGNTIYLKREKIKPGFYFKKDGQPDFKNPITVGTFICINKYLAFFDENREIQKFIVDDGYHHMTCNDWYGTGNNQYTVLKIDGNTIYLKLVE